MSDSQAKQIATKYLKEQAEIIAKYGSAPKLSGERFKQAVTETQRNFRELSKTSK
jgi:hypothetical protein